MVGTWTDVSPPAQSQLASSITKDGIAFFFYYSLELRTALERVDTSSEGYVMICMFWSWRMKIRCWAGCLANNLSHSISWKCYWSSWTPRQMYGGRRLFLLDFPWFLFQIRCTRGLLLESLIWKGTIWNDCPTDGFLLCSNSRLSVPSLIHLKSRKVASLEHKFNGTDALLPSACVPTRRLFSPLLPDPWKKKSRPPVLYLLMGWRALKSIALFDADS